VVAQDCDWFLTLFILPKSKSRVWLLINQSINEFASIELISVLMTRSYPFLELTIVPSTRLKPILLQKSGRTSVTSVRRVM
jgi:hypothetical protein